MGAAFQKKGIFRVCGSDEEMARASRNSRWRFANGFSFPLLLVAQPSGRVCSEALMAAHPQIVCTQCDKPEDSCTCEKYCTICKGQHNVRLCADGLYYCPDCREACDVALANER
jgi:hypothetical protein